MSDTTNPSGVSDSDVGHVFDQTNGVVDALDGESGGTAAGDVASAADRDEAVPTESDAATAPAAASAGATADRPGDDVARPEPAERTPDDDFDGGVTSADEFAVDRSGNAVAVTDAHDAAPDDVDGDTGAGAGASTTSLTADGDDGIGHVFDQTNGVADGLSGDSDGSAESDIASAGERANDDPTFDDATVSDAGEGVEDLDRRNP